MTLKIHLISLTKPRKYSVDLMTLVPGLIDLDQDLRERIIYSAEPEGEYVVSILDEHASNQELWIAGVASRFRPVLWIKGKWSQEGKITSVENYAKAGTFILNRLKLESLPRDGEILLVDTETTGTEEYSQIIQLYLRKHGTTGKTWNIRPTIPIESKAIAVHGITEKMLEGAPAFHEVAEDILEYIGAPHFLVGYNVEFDHARMVYEFIRVGLEKDASVRSLNQIALLDVFAIVQNKRPRSLSQMYTEEFGLPFKKAHSAKADAEATWTLLNHYTGSDEFKTWYDIWVATWPDQSKFVGPGRKLLRGEHGPLWGFGKNKGKLIDYDWGYATWVSQQNFPFYLLSILEQMLSLPYEEKDQFLDFIINTKYPYIQETI